MLNQVLIDEINIGYQNLSSTQLLCVNRVRVRNLKHLVDLIEGDNSEPFVRFDLDRDKYG